MKAIFTISLLLLSLSTFADDFSDHFVTTWKTDNPGPSNDTSIIVPMKGGPYDVDWNNDGVFDEFGINGTATHDYMVAGTYTIRIRGSYDSIQFMYIVYSHIPYIVWLGDGEKIISLDQWGTNPWTSMHLAFARAPNLQIPATDAPDLSALTDMADMFSYATLANPDVSGWDTSTVTDMSSMFSGAISANPDVSGWDTSAVTDMSSIFRGATSSKADVSGWNTSAVTNMGGMFQNARLSNPDVSDWDTSAVTNMSHMFFGAAAASPDVSGWDTSAVTSMFNMFSHISTNPDVSAWDTSAVMNVHGMFAGTTSANPDVSGWDTSAVTDMGDMFADATSANPDVSGWDTGAVTNMQRMFLDAVSAKPDVSGWDTSAVTTMERMFAGATSFNQNLGSWDVTAVKYALSMFSGVTLSPANYEGLLIGWSTQELNSLVNFDGGRSTYCSAEANAAKERMIADYSWKITDGGQSCRPTGVRATDGDYPNLVQVTFNPVAGATVYRVFRCLDSGYTCGLPIGYVTTPTFNDTKGNFEQVYYYRVRACMASGCSKFSVADTGFTAPAPDRPTEIRATDGIFENRVQVTFNTVEGATVYRVFRCPDRDYTCELPIGYPKTGTFEDRKGDAGTVYYYRVRACTATTCGKFSVANAGHRAVVPVARSDKSKVIVSAVPGQSLNDVPIPSLNDMGRWLLILMTLGVGLLLTHRRCQER